MVEILLLSNLIISRKIFSCIVRSQFEELKCFRPDAQSGLVQIGHVSKTIVDFLIRDSLEEDPLAS